jgi:23S rRNA pseudouridine2605 synthase
MGSPASPSLVRLNKAIAAAGVCSRRKADELISNGSVRVNGQVVDTPGVSVDPSKDRIEVSGKLLSRPSTTEELEYVLLHKPVRVMTTTSDPQGRRTVYDLLPPELRAKRLLHVGRLDLMSEGLLLLTTDGDLAHRLTHPSHHLPKIYRARVRGELTESALAAMRTGMLLEDGTPLAPVTVRVVERNDKARESLLELTLIQGVNRQIRRMCACCDLEVRRLSRVSMGPLQLGDLPSGAWRRLSNAEVDALRKAVGLKA